jgi:hypothetical protein
MKSLQFIQIFVYLIKYSMSNPPPYDSIIDPPNNEMPNKRPCLDVTQTIEQSLPMNNQYEQKKQQDEIKFNNEKKRLCGIVEELRKNANDKLYTLPLNLHLSVDEIVSKLRSDRSAACRTDSKGYGFMHYAVVAGRQDILNHRHINNFMDWNSVSKDNIGAVHLIMMNEDFSESVYSSITSLFFKRESCRELTIPITLNIFPDSNLIKVDLTLFQLAIFFDKPLGVFIEGNDFELSIPNFGTVFILAIISNSINEFRTLISYEKYHCLIDHSSVPATKLTQLNVLDVAVAWDRVEIVKLILAMNRKKLIESQITIINKAKSRGSFYGSVASLAVLEQEILNK